MSSNVTNISHGQANWDAVANQNFQNLDADSGWTDATVLAPFTGWVTFRAHAHSVEIVSNVLVSPDFDLTTETVLANLPVNVFSKHVYQSFFISFMDGSNTYARCHIRDDCTLTVVSATGNLKDHALRISQTISI